MRFAGAYRVSIASDGKLLAKLGEAAIALHAPEAYQTVHGVRKKLPSRYWKDGTGGIGFAVDGADRSLVLVIDPVVDFATYLSDGSSLVSSIATDADGNTYVLRLGGPLYPAGTGSPASTCNNCQNVPTPANTNVTAAGTYTVQVVATSGTISHTSPVTLVVQ